MVYEGRRGVKAQGTIVADTGSSGVFDDGILDDGAADVILPSVIGSVHAAVGEQDVTPVARASAYVGGEGDEATARPLGDQLAIYLERFVRIEPDLDARLDSQADAVHHEDVAGHNVGRAGGRPGGVGSDKSADVGGATGGGGDRWCRG